jgi:hypothetical protein
LKQAGQLPTHPKPVLPRPHPPDLGGAAQRRQHIAIAAAPVATIHPVKTEIKLLTESPVAPGTTALGYSQLPRYGRGAVEQLEIVKNIKIIHESIAKGHLANSRARELQSQKLKPRAGVQHLGKNTQWMCNKTKT